MPVPGDIVHVRILEDERVVVDRTEPRTCTLERRTAGRAKTMAANVDSIVTVISLGDPPPRLTTLDQLLAFAELESVAAMVVMTKPDRGEPRRARTLEHVYRELGYSMIVVNPKTGENVDGFRRCVAGHRACSAGRASARVRFSGRWAAKRSSGEVSRHGLAVKPPRRRGSTGWATVSL